MDGMLWIALFSKQIIVFMLMQLAQPRIDLFRIQRRASSSGIQVESGLNQTRMHLVVHEF